MTPFLQNWYPVPAKHEGKKWKGYFIYTDANGITYIRLKNVELDDDDIPHYTEHPFSVLSIGSEIVTYYSHPFTIRHSEIQQTNEQYQWVNTGKIILLDNDKKPKGEMSLSGAALILQGSFVSVPVKNQKFHSLRFEPKRISNSDNSIFPKISVRNRGATAKYEKIIRNGNELVQTSETIDDITKVDLGDFIAVFNDLKMKHNFTTGVNYLYAQLVYIIVYKHMCTRRFFYI